MDEIARKLIEHGIGREAVEKYVEQVREHRAGTREDRPNIPDGW